MANIPKYANLAARALQFFWTLLIMALVGNMIANAIGGSPSVINYGMFVAVIAMISLLYLIPATFVEKLMIHPIIPMSLDLLNTLFFFCGAIAFSAELGVGSCGNSNYTNNNSVLKGSDNPSMRCHEAQAVTAFLWFGFVAFAISAVVDFLQGRSAGLTGGRGSSRPAMSQV